MILKIGKIAEEELGGLDGVLAGSIPGQRVMLKLLEKTKEPRNPEVFFLDFTGILVATSSFLRECVLGFRDQARKKWKNVYPVCSNMQEHVREEFENLLQASNDAAIICVLDMQENAIDPELIGVLEGKQRSALQGVMDHGPIDAPGLHRKVVENIKPTAWNNRLNALSLKALVIETKDGRNKEFSTVMKDLKYGY